MNKHKTLRIEAGYSLEEAALLLGIKPNTLYKIEHGYRKPSPLLKLKMAILYKCSIKDL